MSFEVCRAKEEDIPAIMGLLDQVDRVHHEGRPDLFKLATKYNENELQELSATKTRAEAVQCITQASRLLPGPVVEMTNRLAQSVHSRSPSKQYHPSSLCVSSLS